MHKHITCFAHHSRLVLRTARRMREVRAQRGRAPPKRPRGARPIHPFIRQNASFECALHTTRLHTTAHQSTQLHRSASLCIALHRKKTHERIFLLDGRSIPVELSPHSTAGQVESSTSTVRVASSTTLRNACSQIVQQVKSLVGMQQSARHFALFECSASFGTRPDARNLFMRIPLAKVTAALVSSCLRMLALDIVYRIYFQEPKINLQFATTFE